MKPYPKALAIAAVVSVLSLPLAAQTSNNQSSQGMQNASGSQPESQSGSQPGSQEAAKMVPAKAMLSRTLNADKDRQGASISATIRNKVTLSNGTVLDRGTMLMGKVEADDMQVSGTSKLALCFNQARLKNGTVVPVKATIVSVFKPGSIATGNQEGLGDNLPNSWNDGTLRVDQENVIPGVDLHSRIASQNSGVFVSNDKHEMKLPAQSELQLAIAPAQKQNGM